MFVHRELRIEGHPKNFDTLA
jgi:hypothetical protein